MAAAIQLVAGGTAAAYALVFGAVSLLLQIYGPYRKYVHYLKWLTWSLFAYVITAFVVNIPWAHALKATVIPSISSKPDYLMALIAVLGTTISPYLFFRQTSQEVEEVKVNVHKSSLKKKPFSGLRAISSNCLRHARWYGVLKHHRVLYYSHHRCHSA